MSNENNKPLITKAQALLKEYGHEVKTGHLYEVFSKLAGESNWNVASSKKISFLEKVISKFKNEDPEGDSPFDLEGMKTSALAFLKDIESHDEKFNLGYLIDGKTCITKDFTKEPNALFVGAMASGKSIAMCSSLTSWFAKNHHHGMVFIVDTLKGAHDYKALFEYDNVYPVLNSEEGFFKTIDLLYEEALARRDEFNRVNAENIYQYEKITKKTLSRCVLAIEEFHHATFLLNYNQEKENTNSAAFKLKAIMRIGRSYGIWVMAASQKATASEIPADLVANFSNKQVFRVSKAESSYLLGDVVAGTLEAKDRGKCYTDHGLAQFPQFSAEDQQAILKNVKGNKDNQCLLLTKILINDYLSGKNDDLIIQNKKISELCKFIEYFNESKVLKILHEKLGHTVTMINDRIDPFGLCQIVQWTNKGKIAVMFKSKDSKISAKHILKLAKGMEANGCDRGILYTTTEGLPSALYKAAVDHHIEIVDHEDLIRLGEQTEAKE